MNNEEIKTMTVTGDKNSFLSPGNFEHYYRIANMMSKSDMVPKNYKDKPQDILLAMEYGRSLNLGPLQAIQNIAVINGRPCVYGDMMLAVCSGHPEFENKNEEPILQANKVVGYKCAIKRKGRDIVTKTFTIEDAKLAKLWDKPGVWQQYPDRMLQMRARGFALRDSFADALGGVRMVEEVQDYEVIKDVTPKQKPNIEEDLKIIVDKNKTPIPTPVVAELQTKSTAINLDQLTVVRETIKENKIEKQKIDALLQKFNVTHAEQLSSEQVNDFIAQLLDN